MKAITAAYDLECRSSAVTLSDMEIFIFPELLYSLMLANIMSPVIWRWRDETWFRGIEAMPPLKRMHRLKQYIMDHYLFNLDLDTWGLTTKQREIDRFKAFIDPDALKQSNALFGYEGDKYYFSIDIRRHFGLDKYDSDTIPYWKTETVEAMNAFVHRDGYASGAGECVSLSTLYAAALFIVARVPLSDIFLIATPLHSQNFVTIDDGIITNNRRIMTKAMWINGTEISAKARRALENEKVTVVSHESGYIHTLFPDATIDPQAYGAFEAKLRTFLHNDLTPVLFTNFIRHRRDLQPCFQIRWQLHGKDHYIESEKVFAYELESPHSFTTATRKNLLQEIDADMFHVERLPERVVINDVEDFVAKNRIDLADAKATELLSTNCCTKCMSNEKALEALKDFCCVRPKLPDITAKRITRTRGPLSLTPDMSRDEIIARLTAIKETNRIAALAFDAYRDLTITDPQPFLKAAIERNPVSWEGMKQLSPDAARDLVMSFAEESIYEGNGRLAQPDEVWNYKRGDGAEKALLYANYLKHRNPDDPITVTIADGGILTLVSHTVHAQFTTRKQLPAQQWQL